MEHALDIGIWHFLVQFLLMIMMQWLLQIWLKEPKLTKDYRI